MSHILKAYIFEYRSNWHLLLPFIQFNRNETPCETLGLRAHELIFGHNFDDDLDDICDELTESTGLQEHNITKNVLAYLTDLREHIGRNAMLLREQASHARTKAWY